MKRTVRAKNQIKKKYKFSFMPELLDILRNSELFHSLRKSYGRSKEKGTKNFRFSITYSDSSWLVDHGYIGL
jgi:hypothetical protein